jgi:hypothetical protein
MVAVVAKLLIHFVNQLCLDLVCGHVDRVRVVSVLCHVYGVLAHEVHEPFLL